MLASKSIIRKVSDMVVWTATKKSKFLFNSFYDGMVKRGSQYFKAMLIWNA